MIPIPNVPSTWRDNTPEGMRAIAGEYLADAIRERQRGNGCAAQDYYRDARRCLRVAYQMHVRWYYRPIAHLRGLGLPLP